MTSHLIAGTKRWIYELLVVKHYRLTYRLSEGTGFLVQSLQRRKANDLVFVVFIKGKGWILETICKQIAQYFSGQTAFHYSAFRLPQATSYFFAHYSFLQICLKLNPQLWSRRLFVFYTHPREEEVNSDDLVYALNRAEQIFCMNSQSVEALAALGVERRRLSCLIGGADPAVFRAHRRGSGCVGFCAAYYERKSPDTILAIVEALPQRQFILIGRGWHSYPQFARLAGLTNFVYVEPEYNTYPDYYAQMDVFVSAAKLEGGPIPLIETMMCNIVPVASRTGFAPDIIEHGVNGFLFDVDADVSAICELIEQAFHLAGDIYPSVAPYTWQEFATRCLTVIEST